MVYRAAVPGPGLSSRSRAPCWTLADLLHHAAQGRHACRYGPTLPGAHAVEPQCRGQRRPGLRCRSRDRSHELHERGALAAEVREIEPQDAEEAGPARFGADQLVVPVVRAGEEALHHTDDADAARPRFDAELGRDRRRAREPAGCLLGEHPRRIPGRHHGAGLHARAEVQRHRDGLPVALLDLQPARTRTKYPARWRWPARLPPACRGPRLQPGWNGVRRLLSSRS